MFTIETARLALREHVMEDLISHHALFSHGKVMRYLPEIRTGTLEESERNLRASMEPSCGRLFLRIEEKETGQHVGEIGYTIEAEYPVGRFAGLGYFIHERFWGKGYVTEAARALIRYGFEEGGICRFSCGCLKENVASERVMIRCGMVKEAEFARYQWHEGKLKDRVAYRLLREEWRR